MHPFTDPSKTSPGSGTYFPPQSVAFNTVNTAGGWFLGSTAAAYAVLKLLDLTATAGVFSSPRTRLAASATLGAYLGLMHGSDRLKFTQMHNDKTAVLNKYQALPAVQNDLYAAMGGLNYHYQPTRMENNLGKIYNIVWWSGMGAFAMELLSGAQSAWSTISTTLLGTTILSLGSVNVAHMIGVNEARDTERARIGFAEKIALEKAAARAGAQAQAI